MPDELKSCCQQEADASLAAHRDIATCDGCGALLLAYGDQETFQLTVDELGSKEASFWTGRSGELLVVAKAR